MSLVPTFSLVITGLCGYFIRVQMQRISDLETEMQNRIDEEAARQLLADKLDPVREDVREIQLKLDQIMALLMKPL